MQAMTLSAGDSFAGYSILRLVGTGGMGEVYLAQHPRLPRTDALKILSNRIAIDADYRVRFQREADLAASLWHPNIVRVNDRGEFNEHLWIAMDYVDGLDTGQLLAQRYPAGMPVELVADIVSAVAGALDYSHRHGLLHRDVKPANIMVTNPEHGQDRRVLLGDFGIARDAEDISGLTATNMTMGTVAYAAPEQLMGEDIDGRADQYALAATAYHLLTGSQLFPDTNPAVVISRHLNAPCPAVSTLRPDLAPLDGVLAKALSKDPDSRYARCADFATALADAADAQSGSTPLASTTPAPAERHAVAKPPPIPLSGAPAEHERSRRRWLVPTAIAGVIVTVAAATWLFTSHRASRDRPAATPTSATPSSRPSSSPPAAAAPSPPPTTFAAPAPNPNRPINGNCPPACTQIPDTAWIAATSIPLYDKYSWPPLGPLSEPVSEPRFESDELCAAGPSADDERDNAIAAHIVLPQPPGQWQLQVQIVHWRGDPWIAGQQASAVMDAATSLLRDKCSYNSPGVSVSRFATQNLPGGHPGQSVSAVITETGDTPLVAHEYLVSDLRNNTVVEVAMWSISPPKLDWPPIGDDQLLADMVAPLCTAYVNSCSP